jgi:hypothetical protein
MDLSFSRTHGVRNAGATPLLSFELPVLLAASSMWQAGSPTVRALASARQDQARADDWLGALMRIFAPLESDAINDASLSGSFNPLISRRLMVGEQS